MKAIHGLILAIGLGIAGALLNFFYLSMKVKDVENVYFVGIKGATSVDCGDRLSKDDLVPVPIPKRSVGNLADFAVLYSDLPTVEGQPVSRLIPGGSLLLREDLRTPPQELKFSGNLEPGVEQRAMFVPVNSRAFVPRLVVPGDLVDFLVAGPTEIIGPFEVLALGNRLGSAEVLQASKIRQVQENVMTISVKVIGGRLEPKAQKLANMMQAANFRNVSILLHPRSNGRQ